MSSVQLLSGSSSSSGSSTPGYLYLPSGWDAALRAAQATSKSAPWGVIFLGESTFNGISGNYLTGGLPGQIRTALQNKYGRLGEAFSPDWNSHDANAGTYGFTPPFTTSPDQDISGSITVPAGLAHVHKMPTGSSLTIVTPVACGDFDLIMDNTVAGTTNWSLDGGFATGTFTATGNSTTAALSRLTFRGYSLGLHQVVLNGQSVANTCQVTALVCYPNGPAASGCGFYYALKNGFDSGSYMSSPYGTGVPARFSGRGGITGFPVQPSLAFIAFGINDHPVHSPARILHGWGHMIKALKSYKNCSVMLVSYPYPDTNYSGLSASFGIAGSTYGEYTFAYRRLAELYNCAHVDLSAKWGLTALTDGMYASSSDPHPSAAGHNDAASTILPLVA